MTEDNADAMELDIPSQQAKEEDSSEEEDSLSRTEILTAAFEKAAEVIGKVLRYAPPTASEPPQPKRLSRFSLNRPEVRNMKDDDTCSRFTERGVWTSGSTGRHRLRQVGL